MGLLTVIRKNREKEREMRILFLGLDNAGKTTILKKLSDEDVRSVSPTLGFNIKTFIHGKYTLNIYAIAWVVDSGDRLRIQDCRSELHALLTEDRLAGASLLVFANKQDIHGSMNDTEISEVRGVGVRSDVYTNTPLEDLAMQRIDGGKFSSGFGLDS